MAKRHFANYRGGKDSLSYIGKSEVVSPDGVILHRAPVDKEELMVVEIDPQEAESKSINQYNDLFQDRKPHLYNF